MASEDPKLSLDDELARARGLERDVMTALISSRRLAWRVVIVFGVIAILAIAATIGMEPFKKAPPVLYAVRVNDATGDIENFSKLGDPKQSYGDRLARYFINQYMLMCEGYDYNTIQLMYDRCGLFSAPDVQDAYHKKFTDFKEPDGTEHVGLDKQLGSWGTVKVKVRQISLGPKNSAVVRFETTTTEPNKPQEVRHLIATLAYQYVNSDLTEAVVRENPLGFQVNSYKVDVEVMK
ncbi:virB8 family protein [Bordetella sp. FB-8]|uniref:virB8 family protein n=1 Tax=Bordetella sp. FB-8 TaxID=1159870 RepID=UPI00035C71CD|nr:type IV secretion system protein [Bordetella sp. FB-8]